MMARGACRSLAHSLHASAPNTKAGVMTDDLPDESGPLSQVDRYVSFKGIDCAGLSRRVTEALMRHINDPARSNVLWEALKGQLADAGKGIPGKPDALYLICSRVYMLEELFQRYGDEEGAALLHELEEKCC
jgi:hypothetical protein